MVSVDAMFSNYDGSMLARTIFMAVLFSFYNLYSLPSIDDFCLQLSVTPVVFELNGMR